MYVFASHGLFNADALFKIEHAKDITGVAVTNTIPLPPTYTGKKVRQHASLHVNFSRNLAAQALLLTKCGVCGVCECVQVVQLSIAPLLARLIEASHFRRHLYNEEAPVLDPESM